MSLQLPKAPPSRGHVLDERWADQSKYGPTSRQVQEFTWAWLSGLEELLGLVLGADEAGVVMAGLLPLSCSNKFTARWCYP